MPSTGPTGIPLQRYLIQLYWLCVLPLLLLAAWLAYDNAQAIRQAEDDDARLTAINFAASVDLMLRTTVNALSTVAQSSHLDDTEQWPQLYAEAKVLQATLGTDVMVMDAHPPYRIRLNTQAPFGADGPARPNTEAYETVPQALATLQPTIGNRITHPVNPGMVTEVVVPAIRHGQATYALVSHIDADQLQHLLDDFTLPAGWTMTLSDGKGRVLAQTQRIGEEAHQDKDPSGQFDVKSSLSDWRVLVDIPSHAGFPVTWSAGAALGLLVLVATLIGAIVGSAGGRRLGQAVASLTQGGPDRGQLAIKEIQEAKALLNDSTDREHRSEARFRRLFQDAPIGMRLSNRDGVILAQNAALEELFGYTIDDAPTINKWMELAHPDPAYRERAAALRAESTANKYGAKKHTRSALMQITDKQGRVHEVQGQGSYLPDGLLGSFMDVTELRKAESHLRLWAEAFLHADLQLVIADPNTDTILTANPAFASARGYTPEEMTGMHVSLLLPPEQRERMKAGLIERQHLTHFEYTGEHLRKDGSRFPVRIQSTVSRDESGRAISRLTYAIDLTERQRAESEIQALHASLERRVKDRTAKLSEANQALDAFAHTLSHDLRAPLRAMNAYLHMLREDHGAGLPADGRQYLEQIEAATLRMNGMIEAILSLSSSTRHEMQLMSVDLSELATRRLAELAHGSPDRKVATKVAPGLMATGDPRMLDSLMSNLVDNAWKYTSKSPDARIEFHARQKDGKNWFCVTDNGAGFDAQQARKLFQPFQRMHREEDFPGMGIGLATVHRIVKRHNGIIVAEATPGQGATFCFTLDPSIETDVPDPSANV